jgi:hypothetical protein
MIPVRIQPGSVAVRTAMFSSKLISTAALSGLATLGLWVPPTLAQDYPRQPSISTTPQLPSTRLAPQQPARPPIKVECPDGHHYRLTTGSDGGVCKIYVDRGKVTGGFCTDGTNSALQTCSTGCKEITGSGACEKQDPNAADDVTSGGA